MSRRRFYKNSRSGYGSRRRIHGDGGKRIVADMAARNHQRRIERPLMWSAKSESAVGETLWLEPPFKLDILVCEKTADRIIGEACVTSLTNPTSQAIEKVLVTVGQPSAQDIETLLIGAALSRGIDVRKVTGPSHLRIITDYGASLMTKTVAASLTHCGIGVLYRPPIYPSRIGRLERLFSSMNQQLIEELPGYKGKTKEKLDTTANDIDSLLTPAQLQKKIRRWIDLSETRRPNHLGVRHALNVERKEDEAQ